MTVMSDQADHRIWTTQVLNVLDREFGADPDISLSADETLGRGFAPVAFWFVDALVPVICTTATLRGDPVIASLGRDQTPGEECDPEVLAQLVAAQQRYSFGFDAYFDAMHKSALDFAAKNSEMITEHFGTAESYAEFYAESSCAVMQQIAAQSLERMVCAQMKAAFQEANVAAWTDCFPGCFTRGILTSYALAQGPQDSSELASTIKRKLIAAFAAYDNMHNSGGNHGSKQP